MPAARNRVVSRKDGQNVAYIHARLREAILSGARPAGGHDAGRARRVARRRAHADPRGAAAPAARGPRHRGAQPAGAGRRAPGRLDAESLLERQPHRARGRGAADHRAPPCWLPDFAGLQGLMAQMEHYMGERDWCGPRALDRAFHTSPASAAGDRVVELVGPGLRPRRALPPRPERAGAHASGLLRAEQGTVGLWEGRQGGPRRSRRPPPGRARRAHGAARPRRAGRRRRTAIACARRWRPSRPGPSPSSPRRAGRARPRSRPCSGQVLAHALQGEWRRLRRDCASPAEDPMRRARRPRLGERRSRERCNRRLPGCGRRRSRARRTRRPRPHTPTAPRGGLGQAPTAPPPQQAAPHTRQNTTSCRPPTTSSPGFSPSRMALPTTPPKSVSRSRSASTAASPSTPTALGSGVTLKRYIESCESGM